MGEKLEYDYAPTLFPRTKVEEDAITSIFLAVMGQVQPLRDRLLRTIGQSAYKAGNDYEARLHPTFRNRQSQSQVPDARIRLDQRGTVWNALVEVKIGAAELTTAQLDSYLKLVKSQNYDALITISNELCAQPDRPPLRLKSGQAMLRKIPHFHWSWSFVRSEIETMLRDGSGLEPFEAAMLEQFIVYLGHEKSAVRGFTQMPRGWDKFVEQLKVGGRPDDQTAIEMLSAWFQETAEIPLILNHKLEVSVSEIIEEPTGERRQESALAVLRERKDMDASYRIEGHEHPVCLCLDINARTLTFSTRHNPGTLKTPHKQLEKFLHRFHEDGETDDWGGHKGVQLFVHWKRQRQTTDLALSSAIALAVDGELKDSSLIMPDKEIKAFELVYSPRDCAKHIPKPNKVVQVIEEQIENFVSNYVLEV